MTYQKAITPVTDSQEELIGHEEILYSRTDKRGVILSGNEVFRRVSGYDWDRLIGAPHRVLRHPDMPRAVFHLMWKTIQAGKPMCALVKNRTAAGRWYWVLAVVVPVEGGYLSVRIRPTGALFQRTKAIYAGLVLAEQAESLSPDDSCRRLLAQLAEAGFASYEAYVADLLQQVMVGRDTPPRSDRGWQMQALATLAANIKATRLEQQALMAEFDALQSVPTNMRIIASRLEPSGGPISAISDNYKYASTEIARRLDSFAGTEHNQCKLMADITGEAILKVIIAELLSDLALHFSREDFSRNPVNFGTEKTMLSDLEEQYVQAGSSAIQRVGQVASALNEASMEIRRMTLGLDTIRVMGKVESGHLGPGGGSLASTIDQLDSRHAVIARHLQKLMDLSAGIKAAISTFTRSHAD